VLNKGAADTNLYEQPLDLEDTSKVAAISAERKALGELEWEGWMCDSEMD
jgi:hypothetical protein